MPHWGFHFPTLVDGDGQPTRHLHWGGENAGLHFAEDMRGAPSVPAGAGTFELVFESATVTYTWSTGIAKHRDGIEQRANFNDDPAVRYEGQLLLRGDQVRAVRSRLARIAASGLPFLIGLPWEAVPIVEASTGTTITVPSTAALDWAERGVRVLVHHGGYGSVSTVIQSITATTITVLDVLGDAGKLGAHVMPLASVILDPQQGFERYQPSDPVERWTLRARNADAGWIRAATPPSLALTNALADITVESRLDVETSVFFALAGDGSGAGSLTETPASSPDWYVTLHIEPGVTTVADVLALLGSSTVVRPAGTTDNGNATVGADELISEMLTGGVPAAHAEVGKAATLTMYRNRPVWDRSIVIEDTVSDSVQAMTVVLDMGGLPTSDQRAALPDWGRAIAMMDHIGEPWQWAKKMLATIAGSWGSFWLSTHREDLILDSVGTGTLTVDSSEGAGDFWSWHSTHRRDLAITTAAGVVFVRIASAVNNGDGTTTLSIVDENDNAVTIVDAIRAISWLERVRLESEEVSIVFGPMTFQLTIQARTVNQGDL